MRLVRGSASLVMWLEGHGERRLDGTANHDLGEFGRQLQQKGLKINSLNLALAQDVPANAALLVIASPQTDVQPRKSRRSQRYVAERRQPAVAHRSGAAARPAARSPKCSDSCSRRAPSSISRCARATARRCSRWRHGYGNHPITAAFRYNTLFPFARQIGVSESEDWRISPLIEVAQRGWVEMGKLDDKPRSTHPRPAGPVTIAAAFERTVGDRQQRIVVVGNGAFLSNTYLGRGNLQLGIAMVNWLAAEDDLVAIDPRPAPDAHRDRADDALCDRFVLSPGAAARVRMGRCRHLVAAAQSRMNRQAA